MAAMKRPLPETRAKSSSRATDRPITISRFAPTMIDHYRAVISGAKYGNQTLQDNTCSPFGNVFLWHFVAAASCAGRLTRARKCSKWASTIGAVRTLRRQDVDGERAKACPTARF